MNTQPFRPCRSPWRPIAAILALIAGSALALPAPAEETVSWSKPHDWLPDGQTIPGSTITLRPSAPAAAGDAYQWFFNGAPIPGATARDLTLTGLTVAQTGNYFYRRTAAGGATTESTWATVNVRAQAEPRSPVDTTFVARLPEDGVVRSPIAVLADGSVVLAPGGAGGPALRLHADGSHDAGYTLPASAGVILAAAPDGTVLTAAAPYRFDRSGAAQPITLPAHLDPTQPLTAAVFHGDGRIALAQTVQRTDTFPDGTKLTWHYSRLARVLADGSPDPAFTAVAEMSGYVRKLAVDTSDRLLVGRRVPGTLRYQPGGDTVENVLGTYTYLDRRGADGALDPSFPVRSTVHPWSLEWEPVAGDRILTDYARGVHNLQLIEPDGSPVAGWTTLATGWESYTVAPGGRIFARMPGQSPERWNLLPTATRDPNFYAGTLPVGQSAQGLRAFDDRFLLAWGDFTSWSGHVSPRLVRLRTDDVVPPQFRLGAITQDYVAGIPTKLVAQPEGDGPFSYQWLALDGQVLPADTTSPTLALGAPHFTKVGRYQVRVTGPEGTLLGPILAIGPWRPLRLFGLSGRAEVGTGEDVLIAGAAVQGSAGWPEKILVRGAGPALRPYGLDGAMTDPALAWFNDKPALEAENDDWENTDPVNAATATAGLTPFADGSRDATLLRTWVTPGNYTIHLRNRGASDGIGLLELYDLGNTRTGDLDNYWSEVAGLSLRGRVGAGDKVLIGGFIVRDPHELGGGRTLRVLLRAAGPTLARYGIARPLFNPRLTVYDAAGRPLAVNDDWSADGDKASAIASAAATLGLPGWDAGSADAALLVDLPAGAFTAQVASGDGTTGVALLEIYRVR